MTYPDEDRIGDVPRIPGGTRMGNNGSQRTKSDIEREREEYRKKLYLEESKRRLISALKLALVIAAVLGIVGIVWW